MGTAISKAANGIGVVAGNAFAVPIKAIFGKSCEGICSGTWDLICFLEHLCISSLVRLLMVAILTYIILLFFYLLFQVGIIQCIGRSLCKMTWAGCETYWTAFKEISCFLWHKLKNTKRVYRRHRFEDMEEAFSSSDDSDSSEENVRITRRRRSTRDRRKDRTRRSLKRRRYTNSGSHHHVRLKTREVSVRVRGSGRIGKSRNRRSHHSDQHRRRTRYK